MVSPEDKKLTRRVQDILAISNAPDDVWEQFYKLRRRLWFNNSKTARLQLQSILEQHQMKTRKILFWAMSAILVGGVLIWGI